ncbi:MAG: hypothetical protein KF681_16370 [Bdellovibrionaceae bacterium]|nr:hypothetical protein [Pseudobdellovibrionaceae bacterium]
MKTALKRLEKATEEVMKTQGLNEDTEILKLLTEIVREQVPHENSDSATR